ncbi:hypothetical protein H8356DRAFT_1427690 [Neocallimastix lanati (nom. inval.)]|nr:hypothetical protein H8356DRAFT_1427690 [Neocallimastix sp. JGI-2020a]
MSKTFEENTKDFYKELNGECDPEKLLNIAKQGIFLEKPLLNYKSIKDHEYVVDISIITNQLYMINNKKHQQDIMDDLGNISNFEVYDLIINALANISFEIFKYFYSNVHKHLLDNYIDMNINSRITIRNIIDYMIMDYGRDITTLNYCSDVIKKYNIIIRRLYYKCDNNYVYEFVNSVFTNEGLKLFDIVKRDENNNLIMKYGIDLNKVLNYEIIDYIVEGGMNCIYNTNEQLIKIINPQYRGKKYLDRILRDPNSILNLDIEINIFGNELRNNKIVLNDSYSNSKYIQLSTLILAKWMVINISFIIQSLTTTTTRVEQEYDRIYNLAMQTYKKKYFNNDCENQDNIIDKYDIIKFLTTNVGGQPIGLFDSSINKEIYYPVNDNIYKDFVDFWNKHCNKFNEEERMISDSNNKIYKKMNLNEINDINIVNYNKDSKSKYFMEILLKVLNKLKKILGKSKEQKISAKNDKENSDLRIDSKSIGDSENTEESIDQSCEPSDNSELVSKITNEINNKLGNEENNEICLVDALKSNDVSDEVKEAILNGFEDNIKNSIDESLVEETFNNINELKEFVKVKEEEINNYNSLKKSKA